MVSMYLKNSRGHKNLQLRADCLLLAIQNMDEIANIAITSVVKVIFFFDGRSDMRGIRLDHQHIVVLWLLQV